MGQDEGLSDFFSHWDRPSKSEVGKTGHGEFQREERVEGWMIIKGKGGVWRTHVALWFMVCLCVLSIMRWLVLHLIFGQEFTRIHSSD